jgi:hypothetical protein
MKFPIFVLILVIIYDIIFIEVKRKEKISWNINISSTKHSMKNSLEKNKKLLDFIDNLCYNIYRGWGKRSKTEAMPPQQVPST